MRMALRCIGAGGLVLLVTSVVTPAALGTDAPTFSVSPQDAPVDTVINVQSTTPCPGGSTVNIYVSYYTRSDAVSVTQFSVSTAPDGSWTGSFTANPGSMSGPGPASIGATCNLGSTVTQTYGGNSFDVTTSGRGYWLLNRNTGLVPCFCEPTMTNHINGFGPDASYYGSVSNGFSSVVAMAVPSATGTGYWLAGADGGVANYGSARFYGSLPGLGIHTDDIVGIASTPDGGGYWLAGADGGVFSFGDARFFGSMGGKRLNEPVVGIASTPYGSGYWLVGADGGVFAFGDAGFYGSVPGLGSHVSDIVGMAPAQYGSGYWLVGADGGVFSFDTPYFGSLPDLGIHVDDIVGMTTVAYSVEGYWLVGADGGVFSIGDVPFEGSCSNSCASSGSPDTVAIAATPLTDPTPASTPQGQAGQMLQAAILPPGAQQIQQPSGSQFSGPSQEPACNPLVDEAQFYEVTEAPSDTQAFLTQNSPSWIPTQGGGYGSGPGGSSSYLDVTDLTTGEAWSDIYSQLDFTIATMSNGDTGIRVDGEVVPPGAQCLVGGSDW